MIAYSAELTALLEENTQPALQASRPLWSLTADTLLLLARLVRNWGSLGAGEDGLGVVRLGLGLETRVLRQAYVKARLFLTKAWTVREWLVLLGRDAAPDSGVHKWLALLGRDGALWVPRALIYVLLVSSDAEGCADMGLVCWTCRYDHTVPRRCL